MHSASAQRLASDAVTIEVVSDACPQLPLRVLGLLAQQGLVADRFECHRDGSDLNMSVIISGLPAQKTQVMVEKMRTLIGTRGVSVGAALPSGGELLSDSHHLI